MQGMDNEDYAETRTLLVQAVTALDLLRKRQSLYLSEDALTLQYCHMVLNILLADYRKRYHDSL